MIEQIASFYESNPGGGVLHIVLDDGNVTDADLEYCRGRCIETGNREGLEILSSLVAMNEENREAVIDAFWGASRDAFWGASRG